MPFEMSVNGITHNAMKGKCQLSELNDLKQKEISRRRKMRIEQVRQQSKDIAYLVRRRVQDKKEYVLKVAENKENSKLQNWNETKLKVLQQKYSECLGEVGLAHTRAATQPDPVNVLTTEKEVIDRNAKMRAKQASERLKAEREVLVEKEMLPKMQKRIVRAGEDLRSASVISVGEKTADERAVRRPLGLTSANIPRSTVCHPVVVSACHKSQEADSLSVESEENQNETSDDSTVPDPFQGRPEGHKFVELPEVNLNPSRDSVKQGDEDLKPITSDPFSIWGEISEKYSSGQDIIDEQQPKKKLLELGKRSNVRDAWCSPIPDPKEEQSSRSGTTARCCQQRVIPVWTSRRALGQLQSCSHVQLYDHSARHQQKYSQPAQAVQKADDLLQKNAMQAAEEESAAIHKAQKESFEIRDQQEQMQESRSNQALAKERLKRQYQLLLSELQILSRQERLARSRSMTRSAAAALLAETRRRETKCTRQKNMDSVFEKVYHTCFEAITGDKNILPHITENNMAHHNFRKLKSPIIDSGVKLNVGHYFDPQKASIKVPSKEYDASECVGKVSSPILSEQELKNTKDPIVSGREILEHTTSISQKPDKFNELEKKHWRYKFGKMKPTSVLSHTSVSNESTVSELSPDDNKNVLNSKNIIEGMESKYVEQHGQCEHEGKSRSRENASVKGDAALTPTTPDELDQTQNLQECNSDSKRKLDAALQARVNERVSKWHEVTDKQNESHSKNTIHCECSDSSTDLSTAIGPTSSKNKVENDFLCKVDSTLSSSLYSTGSESNIYNTKRKYFADEEDSLKTNSSESSDAGIKIVVKFCEQCECEHSLFKCKQHQVIDHITDSDDRSKSYKHCKEHCGKKSFYRGFTDKGKSKGSYLQAEDSYNNSDVSRVSEDLQEIEKKKDRCAKNASSDEKNIRITEKPLNEFYFENISSVERENGKVDKDLDDNVNTTSASTSYFSPPDKLSAARAKEIETALETLNPRSQMTDLKEESRFSSALSCYIRRLLAMSRESIENLNVRSSEASTPSKQLVNCSENEQSFTASVNSENSEKNTSLSLTNMSHKQGSAVVDTSDKGVNADDTLRNNEHSRSVVCECDSSGAVGADSNLPDYLLELREEQYVEDLQNSQEASKYSHAVTAEEHNKFIVTMNKRIASALDEIADTVSSVEPNVTGPEFLYQEQGATVSSNSCSAAQQADLSMLADKYSKRILHLSKKLESLRLEKQQIVEILPRDRDVPTYVSPLVQVADAVVAAVQPGPAPAPTPAVRSDSSTYAPKPKPPVSLTHKFIRDVWNPHELSTIAEVDSHTQGDDTTKHLEGFSANDASHSAGSDTTGLLDTIEKGGGESSNKLTEKSADEIRDIMAELIKRKLLTSPYSWMKEDYRKELTVVAEHLPADSQEKEPSDGTAEINSSSPHNTAVRAGNVTSRNSSKLDTLCTEASAEEMNINSEARDLHSVFQNLGINWASSMLRKTREARAYPASSSDSSREASLREGNDGQLDSTASVMRQESSSGDYLNITAPDISLVAKYIIPNAGSDTSSCL